MSDSYADIFARRARAYQAAMARWPDARAEELAMAIAPLPIRAGERVCDMPAGGGYLHPLVSTAGGRYVAVEPAADFFACCPEGGSALRIHAPIEAVPLADGTVDHVVSLAGLHHAPDLSAVFGEMRRLLQPGGHAAIIDVAAGSVAARFLNGFVAAHNPMGHDGRFLDEATAPMLAAAGLRVISDTIERPAWCFADVAEAGRFATMLFGLDGVEPVATAAAMTAEFEVRAAPGGIALLWPLRRIVCVAV